MKSKITTFIISVIMILIVCVFILFGIILWEEIKQMQISGKPENIITVFSDNPNVEDNKNVAISTGENPFEDIESGSTNQQNYIEEYNDKYLYDQLEEPAKIIYKAFESNKENMKTGTYKINLGDKVSNVLSQTNGQEKLGEYYQSAIEAYTYDNPEIFYLDPTKMYINMETTTTLKGETHEVYINNGTQSSYLIHEFSSKNQINTALQQIEEVKNKILSNRTGNIYQDIKMVHDYLIDNIEYDESISKDNIYNIYGALVNKVAVCEGYAESFKYLMNEMQIPCVIVIGTGTNSQGESESHAWNYVELDGNWYAIDVTWDDPIIIGGGVLNQENKYKHFLKGRNTFLSNHISNGQFTQNGKIFEYPSLSEVDYR